MTLTSRYNETLNAVAILTFQLSKHISHSTLHIHALRKEMLPLCFLYINLGSRIDDGSECQRLIVGSSLSGVEEGIGFN